MGRAYGGVRGYVGYVGMWGWRVCWYAGRGVLGASGVCGGMRGMSGRGYGVWSMGMGYGGYGVWVGGMGYGGMGYGVGGMGYGVGG